MILEKPAGVCHNGIQIGQMLMLILNIPMLIIVGSKYYKSAFLGLLHGIYGMDLLVMTGTSITFTYSVIQLCLSCISDESTDHVFFETTGMLLFFVTIGKYIESYAKGRSASSIAELLKLQPRDVSSFFCFSPLFSYLSFHFSFFRLI
jgi:Cu+-exporting ATPase